ncbi:thioredoxin family protein [Flavobacteriales bacterium 34_180_T64]|nr:thioredoxin family protein [Flavobacteriales bacterium 34_180_T64]
MIKDKIEYNKQKSVSYKAYRDIVTQMVDEQSTTGNDKSEAMVNYTMLNNRRMKRWDKTIKISHESREKILDFRGDVTWLVITESWCGDAAHVTPVMNKVAELNPGIDLKLVLRDENDALMNQFLTNGGRAIPKLIMIDNSTNEVLNTYGPRPSEATKLVADYKDLHGSLSPEFKEDLQHWYNKNKGQNIIDDLIKLIES